MSSSHTNIKLPSEPPREDPILKPASDQSKDPKSSAVFIFVHGLSDSGSAVENVADQFQQGGKLPHMSWILPSAKHNHDFNDTAWYLQNTLSAITPSRPELAPDEDEDGMLETVAYLESLIDACIDAGIPPKRIVLGGFSQGCAMSLLLQLTSSKYGGKLAGIVGLLGYLPLCDGKQRLQELRMQAGFPEKVEDGVPVFLAKGGKDPLIPRRVWNYSTQTLRDMGLGEDLMQVTEYEGLTHTLNGPILRDLCSWLEKVVPPLE